MIAFGKEQETFEKEHQAFGKEQPLGKGRLCMSVAVEQQSQNGTHGLESRGKSWSKGEHEKS